MNLNVLKSLNSNANDSDLKTINALYESIVSGWGTPSTPMALT